MVLKVNQNSFARLKVGFSTITVNGYPTLAPCSRPRHYHYLGATYTNMTDSFPAFYAWMKASGLAVPMASYALVEGSCGRYGLDESTGAVRMLTLEAGVFGRLRLCSMARLCRRACPISQARYPILTFPLHFLRAGRLRIFIKRLLVLR